MLDFLLMMLRGAFVIFTCIKEPASGKCFNARNFKENFGKPHFVLALCLYRLRKRKCGRPSEIICRNRETVTSTCSARACANFAKEKSESASQEAIMRSQTYYEKMEMTQIRQTLHYGGCSRRDNSPILFWQYQWCVPHSHWGWAPIYGWRGWCTYYCHR